MATNYTLAILSFGQFGYRRRKKVLIWSALPVLNNKFHPVLRFYASLTRASLLQG